MPQNDNASQKHKVEIVKTYIVWERPPGEISLGPYSDLLTRKSFVPRDPDDVRDAALVIEGADGAQYVIRAVYAAPYDEVSREDEGDDGVPE